MLEIKDEIKLHRAPFGYFGRCFLAKFFLNIVFFLFTRNLSSSVIEKLNGYETIRQTFARKERVDIIPVDIVYEPTYDENIPVPCFLQVKFT